MRVVGCTQLNSVSVNTFGFSSNQRNLIKENMLKVDKKGTRTDT